MGRSSKYSWEALVLEMACKTAAGLGDMTSVLMGESPHGCTSSYHVDSQWTQKKCI